MRNYLFQIKTIRLPVCHWFSKAVFFIRQSREGCFKAFTIFEAIIVLAAVGTLLAVGIPIYTNVLLKAKTISAITDISSASREIEEYLDENGILPEILDDIKPNFRDPWGRPYEYLVILGKSESEIQGKWRKDRFQVPLNTDFDLYSKGKDGESRAPLTASASYDDIVRANNGDYIGLASKY